MEPIAPCLPPPEALLRREAATPGTYTDCYATALPGVVSLAQYVEAFYTSRVFKLERAILRLALSKPSSDAEARQLAQGRIQHFAMWTVLERNAEQLLLRDDLGRTGSWLMVAALRDAIGAQTGTRLYFGSAVMPTRSSVQQGRPRMGAAFQLLLGFHKLYTRVLLGAAVRSLTRQQQQRD